MQSLVLPVIYPQVHNGVEDLSNELQERLEFYERWTQLEKWLTKTQKKVDAVSDVYSDEVNDVYIKTEVREIPELERRNYLCLKMESILL